MKIEIDLDDILGGENGTEHCRKACVGKLLLLYPPP